MFKLIAIFNSEYDCEIEYVYDFQISNQLHPQNSRFCPLYSWFSRDVTKF